MTAVQSSMKNDSMNKPNNHSYTDDTDNDVDECSNCLMKLTTGEVRKATTESTIREPLSQQQESDSFIPGCNLNDNCSLDPQTNAGYNCSCDSSSSPLKGQSASPCSLPSKKKKNHSNTTTHLFVGPFAHIRKSLDYNYHSNYSKERQWLQDSIIEDILGHVVTRQLPQEGQNKISQKVLEEEEDQRHHPKDNGDEHDQYDICTVPTDPWLIFTAGVQGSGKFHTIRTLVQQGYLPLLGFVHVDSDRIRRMLLPEAAADIDVGAATATADYPYDYQHHYNHTNTKQETDKGDDDDNAEPYRHCQSDISTNPTISLTYYTTSASPLSSSSSSSSSDREAGYIAEISTLAALYAGKNVILDAAMKNINWYQQLFQHLRVHFTSLRLALLHIIAPRDCVFQWSMKVAMESKRIVPIEDLQQAMIHIPQAMKILKQHVDFYCEILNLPVLDTSSSSINELPNLDDVGIDPTELFLLQQQVTPVGLEHLRICTWGITWDSFQNQFLQKCAWIPKKFKKKRIMEDQNDHHHHNTLSTSTSTTSLTTLSLDQEMEASKDALGVTFNPLRTSFIQPFHVHLSTEENYYSSDKVFYGPYAYLRKTLDYSYHRNYKRDRQVLQDAIISNAMTTIELTDVNGDVCSTPTEPFIVFTAGAMGAGKSYTIHHLQNKGRFPLMAFVRVDPDEIRRHLPEFQLYVDYNPSTAGELTRKECGYIAEVLTLAALEAGKNVIVDGSLRDHEWYKVYFARLRKDYPLLKLAILHICAPRQAVFARAADRALKTGRVVPLETLELALDQVPLSVKILSPLVDYFCELYNAPNSEDIELRTPGITWETFTQNWRQTCAWVPRRKMSYAR